MSHSLFDSHAIIFQEMLAHIPLFTHRKPHHVAILNDHEHGVIQEVLKHPTVSHIWQIMAQQNGNENRDTRIKHCYGQSEDYLAQIGPSALDVLIIGQKPVESDFTLYHKILHSDGILIQLCESPFDLADLKTKQQQLKKAGFHDIQALQFPEPTGWRAAIMATKHGTIKRPREKDIFNKPFSTRYYNFDIHKAAFALPEFMRTELLGE